MSRPNPTLRRALLKFALAAAAGIAAASLYAQGAPVQGLLLDAQAWQEEVVAASTGPWPADGWYRLAPRGSAVEVRSVRPVATGEPLPGDTLYFRLPGVALKEGLRRAYRYPDVLQQVRPGTDYELALGSIRFSLRVERVSEGLAYSIGYGGQYYHYVLGTPGADHTAVRSVADLDGDGQPDFLVDVDDAVVLLLSTRALPGHNVPAAEWVEHGC